MSKLDLKFIKQLAKYKATSSATWDLKSLFYEGVVNQTEEVNGTKVKVLSLGKREDPEFIFTTLDTNQFWQISVSFDSYSGIEIYLDRITEVVPEEITITRYNAILK